MTIAINNVTSAAAITKTLMGQPRIITPPAPQQPMPALNPQRPMPALNLPLVTKLSESTGIPFPSAPDEPFAPLNMSNS